MLAISDSIFRCLGVPNRGFRTEGIAKHRLVVEIVFKEFRNRLLMFSGCLEIRFSDFLGLENKLENETIFDEIPNPPFWIW